MTTAKLAHRSEASGILPAVRVHPTRHRRMLAGGLVLALLVWLGLAAMPADADAYRLAGKRWPGRTPTIELWNGTGYDEELRIAMRAWNTSGVRVRFRLASRARADVDMRSYPVSLGVLEGYGASGRASLGYSPFSYVRVSRGAKGTPIIGVLAHELGHVLGLAHQDESCGLMNTLPWLECYGDQSCDVIQPDDLRGALRRYGGRARKGRGEMCPAAPAGGAVATLPGSYRAQLTFTLPDAPTVTGYALRTGVGSCPGADDPPARRESGAPGQSILADVTPDDAAAFGKLLCVRLWTSGAKGRISQASATLSMTYQPDPLPAPATISASGIAGGANLAWQQVAHSAVVGYEVAFQSGEACPAKPGDAPAGQRASFSRAQAEGGLRMTARAGRYCVAVWSRDAYGRLSASAATALVDVPSG